MKKFASLLLTVVLLAAMLCVFAVPASAVEAPTEYVPDGDINLGSTGDNFIISRDCEVDSFTIRNSSGQLTIAKGVTVTVKQHFDNRGTINVGGTLNLSDTYNIDNSGMINVFNCGHGKLKGNVDGSIAVFSRGKHHFVNGFCSFCGKKSCDEHKNLKIVCADCGEVISTYPATPTGNTASTLSEGNMTVIVGVVCLAVGFLAAMFIFKKKKPALAGGVETDEE